MILRMLKLFVIGILIISVFEFNVYALKCYTCSTSPEFLDQRCITDPASVQGNAILDCNKNYCVSIRVEYLDPKDKIQSLTRNCFDSLPFMNQVLEEGGFRTYYKACQTDLCNGGSGKDISSGNTLNGDIGDEIVLVVPGIGRTSSSSTIYITLYLLIPMIIMSLNI